MLNKMYVILNNLLLSVAGTYEPVMPSLPWSPWVIYPVKFVIHVVFSCVVAQSANIEVVALDTLPPYPMD